MKELTFTEYLAALTEESKAGNPRPWEAFERYIGPSGTWTTCVTCFFTNAIYRRKPRTVTRTITWPEPVKSASLRERLWTISASGARDWFYMMSADESERLMKAGLLWATKAEAQAAHDALMGGGDE